MALCVGAAIGIEVCKILGIAPDNVQDVDIHLDAGNVAHVHITRFLEVGEIEGIKRVFELYEVRRKD